MEKYMLPCLNKELFGLECYGCGGQRAMALLLKGDFAAAFQMFPAIYPLLFLLGFLILNLFFKFKHDYTVKIGLIIFTAVIMIVSYLYKINQLIN
ncbi:DUF2752 domain-containing protein [Salegentibacter sp. F188]|uniref:DUF2752 domain-containing protein n=1 Tax=Autumnicola patrickiae TaxID=3075591 RepID=A0ABU3E866_9FLAO|nr:DUF2752 domain-containing protein [Salegentibacter sp. F188]MDT0691859.1 DUF2752 domain-containing protein [Salegentibacter sp. F188]